jgi:hypothetical protein
MERIKERQERIIIKQLTNCFRQSAMESLIINKCQILSFQTLVLISPHITCCYSCSYPTYNHENLKGSLKNHNFILLSKETFFSSSSSLALTSNEEISPVIESLGSRSSNKYQKL